MPIIVDIPEKKTDKQLFTKIFDYFTWVDETFSPFKSTSDVSKLNKQKIITSEMKKILTLALKTKKETKGYFDIKRNGKIDPSGLVKGWAIANATELLTKKKVNKFYVEAGGDIQVKGGPWKIGIRNPFNKGEIVKVVSLTNAAIATSGTYERGKHVYNPKNNYKHESKIASISVISDSIYDADRFATAAFAMGEKGIDFIASKKGLDGYMIDVRGIATMTPDFEKYVRSN